VSNPVDILTHLAAHFATKHGVGPKRVIGTGTMLDTARFRTLLGKHYGVDAHHVHAYVIGEHGDSEVLTWSQATIAGVKLDEFSSVSSRPLTPEQKCQLDGQVRGAAYQIIAGKGSTYYGIGSAVARLVDVLLHDQRAILTITCRLNSVAGMENLTLSIPHVVGGEGAIEAIPLRLNATEEQGLAKSAGILRETVASLKLRS
jgi:L-lactate dehydrogenase